jgi:two-component system NarL family sensor kinase
MICADLYPSELAHLGLAAALESLARATSRDENLVVDFVVSSVSAEQRFPEAIEETLYRVARECVSNVCRHAQAEHAWIQLVVIDKEVVLTVRDDGSGFSVPSALATLLRTGHLGLASMREQVSQLGGELTVSSQPGGGTDITVRVQIPDDSLDGTATPASPVAGSSTSVAPVTTTPTEAA